MGEGPASDSLADSVLDRSAIDSVFHSGEAPLAIADLSGTIIVANAAASQILGTFSPEDLVGRKLTDLFIDDRNVIGETLERFDHLPSIDPVRHATGTATLDGQALYLHLTLSVVPCSYPTLILIAMEDPTPCSYADCAAVAVSCHRAVQATNELQRQLLARGERLDGMVDLLHEQIGRPVLVFDASRQLLAESGVAMGDRIAVRRAQAGVDNSPHGLATRGTGYWSAAIVPNGHVLGWLCALDQPGGFDEHTGTVLEQAVSIFTLGLMRMERAAEVEASSLRELADELIGDPTSDRAITLARALTYDLARPHRVLAVKAAEEGSERIALTETALRSLGVRAPLVAAQRHRLFVVLPPVDSPSGDVDGFLVQLSTALEIALGPQLRMGVGRACEVTALTASLEEALFSLELGAALSAKRNVTTFEQLGLWQLLVGVREPVRLRDLVEEWIGDLIRKDAVQRSELVKTLTIYLNESCATESSAAVLFIHRNTLRYRLGKIEQITGRDLSDSDQRFNLEIACRAWEVLTTLDDIRADVDH